MKFIFWLAIASSLASIAARVSGNVGWLLFLVWFGLSFMLAKSTAKTAATTVNQTSLNERIETLIAAHGKTLLSKYEKAVYKDDYGNLVLDAWHEEMNYFIDNVLLKDNDIIAAMNSELTLLALSQGRLTNNVVELMEHTVRHRIEMVNAIALWQSQQRKTA